MCIFHTPEPCRYGNLTFKHRPGPGQVALMMRKLTPFAGVGRASVFEAGTYEGEVGVRGRGCVGVERGSSLTRVIWDLHARTKGEIKPSPFILSQAECSLQHQ